MAMNTIWVKAAPGTRVKAEHQVGKPRAVRAYIGDDEPVEVESTRFYSRLVMTGELSLCSPPAEPRGKARGKK